MLSFQRVTNIHNYWCILHFFMLRLQNPGWVWRSQPILFRTATLCAECSLPHLELRFLFFRGCCGPSSHYDLLAVPHYLSCSEALAHAVPPTSISTPSPGTLSFTSKVQGVSLSEAWPRVPVFAGLLSKLREAGPSIRAHTLICHHEFTSVVILSASGSLRHENPMRVGALSVFSHPVFLPHLE